MKRTDLRTEFTTETKARFNVEWLAYNDYVEWLERKLVKLLTILPVSNSLQDIQEIIEFLKWAFRKIDKGDTTEETVRMLLMNRAKIDNIKFDSNMFSSEKLEQAYRDGVRDALAKGYGTFDEENYR